MSKRFHPGMGQAVAERTILRKKANGKWENWEDVAHRVALGNSLLCKTKEEQEDEYKILFKHLSSAVMLTSGRHLQHGDETQPSRGMEVFTNCSTSANSFGLFYLLMNGCFAKGTLVRMSDGTLRAIDEIKVGDSVISYNKESDQFVCEIVDTVYENQPKPMVKVVLEDDTTILCTEDHLFLTNDKRWVKAVDLEGEDLMYGK